MSLSRKKSSHTLYHKICDSIDESLLSVNIGKMSQSEVLTYYKKLLEVKRKAQICVMLREKHRQLFYSEDQWNTGHTKAIDIKKKLVQSCDKKLFEIAYRIAELSTANLSRTSSSSSTSLSNTNSNSTKEERSKVKDQKKRDKKHNAIETYAKQWLEDKKKSEDELLKQYVDKTSKQMANETQKQITILFKECPTSEMSYMYGDKPLMKCATYLRTLLKKHDSDAKTPFIVIIHWINMRRQMTNVGLAEVMEFVKKSNPETVMKSIETLQSALVVLDNDRDTFFKPHTKYFYYVMTFGDNKYKCVSRADVTVQNAINMFLSIIPAISRENAAIRRYFAKNLVTLEEIVGDKNENMLLREVSNRPLPIFTITTLESDKVLKSFPAALKKYYVKYVIEHVYWFAFNGKYFDIISMILHTHENALQLADILTEYVKKASLDEGVFIMVNTLCSLLKYDAKSNKENLMKSKNIHDIVGVFSRAINKLPKCFKRDAPKSPSKTSLRISTNERIDIKNKEYTVYLGKRGAKYVKYNGKFVSIKKLL